MPRGKRPPAKAEKRKPGRPRNGEVESRIYAWESTVHKMRRLAKLEHRPAVAILDDLVTRALARAGAALALKAGKVR